MTSAGRRGSSGESTRGRGGGGVLARGAGAAPRLRPRLRPRLHRCSSPSSHPSSRPFLHFCWQPWVHPGRAFSLPTVPFAGPSPARGPARRAARASAGPPLCRGCEGRGRQPGGDSVRNKAAGNAGRPVAAGRRRGKGDPSSPSPPRRWRTAMEGLHSEAFPL